MDSVQTAVSPLTRAPGRTSLLVRRGLAAAFDTLLISLISTSLTGVYGVTRVTSGSAVPTPGPVGFARFSTSVSLDWWWVLAAALVYFAIFEGLFAATPGKLLLHLRVVSLDGHRASPLQILVRNLVRAIDALPALYVIGGIAVLTSRQQLRIGDRVAQTKVVHWDEVEDEDSPRFIPIKLVVLGLGLALLVGASAAFNYYGRPPLIIEGEHRTNGLMFGPDVPYTLGSPTWGNQAVSYPVSYVNQKLGPCRGTIHLRWAGMSDGWKLNGIEADCHR